MKKKPITNLCISGITTAKQLRKLTKLTRTDTYPHTDSSTYTNEHGCVYYSESIYADWDDEHPEGLVHLTWEEFLAKYDKPSCKSKLKLLKKENKKLHKAAKELEPTGIPDKAFVECWDNIYYHTRTLQFYDAVNKCTFYGEGKRNGPTWGNYKVVKKLPKWAKEAQKTLEN